MNRTSHRAEERLKRLASMSRQDAIKSMMDERDAAQKCWCDNCKHNVTFGVNGIGMWICDLCRMDITPNTSNQRDCAGRIVKEEK